MPANYLKTGILLLALTTIFVVVGRLVAGEAGMVVAFVMALAINVASYWHSDKMVLGMFGAREADPAAYPGFVEMVGDLAARAGLPPPRVYVMDNAQPNAFATGRDPDHAAVCASTGLLDTLSREEVTGVIAHELGHVRNRDTLTMTIAASLGGAITMLANMAQFGALFGRRDNNGGWLGLIVAIFVAPLAATIVQMAISRSREYQADRFGGQLCGNPLWLASALARISGIAREVPNPEAEQAPAAAHLFIVNPLSGRGVDNLFSTHPDVQNRIAELEALAAEMGIVQRSGPPWSGSSNMGSGPSGPWGGGA